MTLYFDKENVLSLIKSHKHPLYQDCLKTVQKQLSVFFNFSKKDIQNDDNLMAWMQLLNEGVGKFNEFKFLDEYRFPQRPLTEDCHSTFNESKLSAMYLLHDEVIEQVKSQGAILVGGLGEEISTFNKLFLLTDDYDFHKDLEIGGDHFKKWDDVNKYAMPVTDIVFVDSYILVDRSLVESNFIKILQVLTRNARIKVNIVLYVNSDYIATDFAQLYKSVIDEVAKITGVKPNFTMIKYKRKEESLAEHDRTILTNYIRIKSGDTYNYFNSLGRKITTGREISYLSLCKLENHNLAKGLISDLQKKIDSIKVGAKTIEGDKVSNYLNLN